MRLASEHDENVQALEIFDRANEELVALAEFGPDGKVRRRILDTCVDDIQALNGSTTGSTSVILAFLRKSLTFHHHHTDRPIGRRPRTQRADSPTVPEDVEYLVDSFDFAALAVRELVEFVEGHRSVESISRTRKLRLRLELLRLMLMVSPKCLSKELHAQLWLYLVGEKALGSSERDIGCEFYNEFFSPNVLLPFPPPAPPSHTLINACRSPTPCLIASIASSSLPWTAPTSRLRFWTSAGNLWSISTGLYSHR